MNTVLDHLNAALDALDAELARITEARNDTATLIEQLRPTASAPEIPVVAPETGPSAHAVASAPKKPRTPKKATQQPPPPAKRPNTATVDYHEVAAVIQRARSEGRSQRRALMEHFDVPMTTVANWITKVYQLGLLDKQIDLAPKADA